MSFYDKRNVNNLNIVGFPYKSSTIPLKMFFAINTAEARKVFLHQMLSQGAYPLDVKKILVKKLTIIYSNLKNKILSAEI